jgi:hypothetical protein
MIVRPRQDDGEEYSKYLGGQERRVQFAGSFNCQGRTEAASNVRKGVNKRGGTKCKYNYIHTVYS